MPKFDNISAIFMWCSRAIACVLAPAIVCFAQNAESLPAFEVASVRMVPDASDALTSISPFGANQYSMAKAPLALMIQLAYDVPAEQIDGIEKLGKDRYDLAAKAEDGLMLTLEQVRPRLRRLLEERFQLRVHHESKLFDGYALVTAKGGPRLKPASEAGGMGMIYPGGLRLTNVPIASFATSLRTLVGRPVIDKTSMPGKFDFELTFARDNDPDSPLPSFTTALQEKYGLRLEKTKVSLDMVVVDSVETLPRDN